MSIDRDRSPWLCVACLALAILLQPSAAALAAEPPPTNEQLIMRALDHRVTFDLSDQTLRSVLNSLIELPPEKDRITMVFDYKALEDAGSDVDDVKVTLRATNIRLRSALNLALRPLDLDWTIKDEVLLITTREKSSVEISVRVYEVDDLVIRDDDESRTPDFASLIRAIMESIAPTTWSKVGGPASIESYAINGCRLVIGQTDEVHLEIAQLLRDLRETPPLPGDEPAKAAEEATTGERPVEAPPAK